MVLDPNDNDTTLPKSAAVKDYVDTANTNPKAYVHGLDIDDDLGIAGDSGTGTVNMDIVTYYCRWHRTNSSS